MRDGEFELVSTPTCVALTESGVVCGEQARNFLLASQKTVVSAKHLLSHNLIEHLQSIKRGRPFRIAYGTNNTAFLEAKNGDGKPAHYSTHSAVSDFFCHIKSIVEEEEEERVKISRTIITVPVHYTCDQLAIVKRVAEAAKLPDVCLVQEPVAAATAHNFMRQNATDTDSYRMLMLDYGGGKLNVSIVEKCLDHTLDVVHSVDVMTGGDDIDHLLAKYCVDRAVRFAVDRESLPTKTECETVKFLLAQHSVAKFPLKFDLRTGQPKAQYQITRKNFNDLIMSPICARMDYTITKVLQIAGWNDSTIDYVLMLGGSSLIPAVQQRVENRFKGKLRRFDNAEHLLVYGAAIWATKLLPPTLRPCPSLSALKIPQRLRMALCWKEISTRKEGPLQAIVPCGAQLPAAAFRSFEIKYQLKILGMYQRVESTKAYYCDDRLVRSVKIDKRERFNRMIQLHVKIGIDESGLLTVHEVFYQ